VLGAKLLGMIPVGTMGHEHVQRYGDDDVAFRAMRERRPGRSSYLLDTFDTLRSGLPAAFEIMAEDPAAGDSIRYDSGDKLAQYRHAVATARARGLRPVHILEDGFDAELTRTFEREREALGVPASEQFYGYGGFLISDGELTRDKVSAVYKLSRTGKRDVMKFADEVGEGKRSLPGRPVVWRRVRGEGPDGIVGQAGEPVPEGYVKTTGAERDPVGKPTGVRLEQSPATRALVLRFTRERDAKLAEKDAEKRAETSTEKNAETKGGAR
jgi:nicotinic acid phosphoribosyltransferase